ncbi:uncharacterized protein LOC114941945 [Nylanderia fulva]|uniref:uncharacterized protein LOC114941945 n=1 Tax=Nylanderia fulva TaxID=613905 RepID=UPI0010FB1361|nr:uncharacterized protein LOC114941945 [Nylanderia fulva]
MAILEAINKMKELQIRNVTIFSDSKSVLTALSNISLQNRISHLIFKIKHSIKEFNENGGHIRLVWIPSHCGINRNEMADKAAKEAPKQGRDYYINTSIRDFSSKWKDELFDLFFTWCKDTGKCKAIWYMKNCLTSNRVPWFQDFNISRESVVSICRLRCDHTSLKVFTVRSLRKAKVSVNKAIIGGDSSTNVFNQVSA